MSRCCHCHWLILWLIAVITALQMVGVSTLRLFKTLPTISSSSTIPSTTTTTTTAAYSSKFNSEGLSSLPGQQAAPLGGGLLDSSSNDITPKSVTKEIVDFFGKAVVTAEEEKHFIDRLAQVEVREAMDGLHILTLLFQCARTRRMAKIYLPLPFMVDTLLRWER